MLRDVLAAFENASGPRTLNQLARELDVSPGLLEGMIEFWVRKGRLREVTGDMCTACGHAQGCPFVMQMPRSFVLATGDSPPPEVELPCGCCG